MPIRIQRKRTKGWRAPPNVVYVGAPTKWRNPWRDHRPSGEAVSRYKEALLSGELDASVDDVIRELRDRDLMCWCPLDQPCHADVLIEVANAGDVDAITCDGCRRPVDALRDELLWEGDVLLCRKCCTIRGRKPNMDAVPK